jgi:hypothetical protein
VDPVPEPPLKKGDSAGNRNQDLWVYNQKLRSLDRRVYKSRSEHYLGLVEFKLSHFISLKFVLIISPQTVFLYNVRFEVFTAVTMKNGVFWDAMPYGSCKNRGFGRT